jgi:S1-C subfamily serine protease
MSDLSRRGLLTAAGATLAAATGANHLDLEETYDEWTGGLDEYAGTASAPGDESSGDPYAAVYEEAIGSVVTLRVFRTRRSATGSGFVRGDGSIVTNQHVVDGADRIDVAFSEGEWRTAEVLGSDAYTDLAALSVDRRPGYATPLPMLEADPPIGTRVMALGNPFQLEASASEGIVSGVDRSLSGPNDFPIPDAIQTDAAVNPGNSGGPLVTLDGRVVGVITAGGGENIGFAISAPLTERVVPELVASGSYAHPYVGVRLLTVTPAVADANDLTLEEPRGILVSEVVDGSPADGVLQGSSERQRVRGREIPVGGDVILALDGTATPTLQALSSFIALEKRPGEAMDVTVLRDGRRTSVELTLGERPPP